MSITIHLGSPESRLQELLNMRSAVLPSCTVLELELWRMASEVVKCAMKRQEPNLAQFLVIDHDLKQALAGAPHSALGALACPSTCSFYPLVSRKDFADTFGRHEPLSTPPPNWNHLQSRFAHQYWLSVHRLANQKTPEACAHFFLLDSEIVETITHAKLSNIADFCDQFSFLQKFVLTSPKEDCLSIIEIASDPNRSEKEKKLDLSFARSRKFSHSSSFTFN